MVYYLIKVLFINSLGGQMAPIRYPLRVGRKGKIKHNRMAWILQNSARKPQKIAVFLADLATD